MELPILTLVTFSPLVGMVVVLLLRGESERGIKGTATVFSGISLVFATLLLAIFDRSVPGFQFVERAQWIPPINVWYYLGVDGLSITMIFLTALLSFVAVIASYGIKDRMKQYFALFLLLQTAMTGVFVALDFFLFYVFWEAMLVPMYFLIGIWGGPNREYAAIKFFLYTLLGSVAMLLAILAMYFSTTPHTFDIVELARTHPFAPRFQMIVFLALFLGFAIKVPVFPFHTWLPDAHVEAPTAISVILAGVLLKMGIYGILRISYPILPDAARDFAFPLAILAAINIIYGALVAMAQSDLKKLVAYSSVSHMGYCLLGMSAMTATGMNGTVLQMFGHGIITGSLFLLVGVIYDRAHHRDIDRFGGLAIQLPIFTGIMSLAAFASLGLPGLAGFVGEFMCFVGAFPVFKTIVIISAIGIVITAGYLLWMLQRMFLGKPQEQYAAFPDMSARELVSLVPLQILTVAIGVYPWPIIDFMDTTIESLSYFLRGGLS
ncbi:MAG: NADH-quinone oxidoreductase subunit M [Candidatus Eiseniibacteriota bacterium]|nr:MAG: NADH-quinone oxidoreductase subunit M [Candidatus Eisenbacteria bacterium]